MADAAPASHETWDRIAHQAVQGPLAKIIAGLETVENDGKSALTPAAKQTVHGSIVTARRLMDMFESLLAVERLTTGDTALGTDPVTLGPAVEPALKALEARAKAAEITYGWTANEIGLAVAGDEDLLRRAFRLAAERALDDVPKGGSFRASASTGGGAVRLRITGSAVTDEEAVFAVSEPVEIAFARLAVEGMGGKLTCTRSRESGSMIDLVLPLPAAKPAPVKPESVPAPAPTPTAPVPEPAKTIDAPIAAKPEVPELSVPSLRIELTPPAPGRLPEPVTAGATPPDEPPAPGATGSKIQMDAAIPAPSHEATPEPEAGTRDSSAAPALSGLVMTAPWTGSSKKGSAGPGVHHAHSSAAPPGTEHMDDNPPAEEPPGEKKTGGLKITRHVDFDLMSQE